MSSISREIGIDVGQETLVVSIDQARPFELSNTRSATQEFAAQICPGDIVHLEASGGYERRIMRALRKAGAEVRLHDPLKARRLAQGRGRKAKTDPIDAKELSADGGLLPSFPPKSEARENLTDLSRAISALQAQVGQFRQRCARLDLDPDAEQGFLAVIKAMQEQIRKMETRFLERASLIQLDERLALAMSVPAIGAKTARVCICELPENFRTQTTEQICSYAGLAPIDCSSGKTKGTAHIGKGNRRLKAGLYMAALCALRDQDWAKKLYAQLRAKGREHRQAIVAVMRRLLVRVLAVLKRETPWSKEPPPSPFRAKLPATPLTASHTI